MAVIIPNVVNWSVTPQNGQEDYFTKMNIWLSESTSVIASLNTAITKINESNTESNDNLEEVLTARDQTVAARNEAVTAVATLTAGAIDDTTIATNKAFSNQYIKNNYYNKTEINNKTNINGFDEKTTPINTDNIAIQEVGGLFKKLSWSNLKITIINHFGSLMSYYLTSKVDIADNDIFIIGDYEAYDASKKVTFINLKLNLLNWFSAGYSRLFTTNGYMKFPNWLGGFIIQWQKVTNGTATVNFPIAFPTACLTIQGTVNANAYYGIGIISFSKTGFTYTAGGGDAFVLAIGY